MAVWRGRSGGDLDHNAAIFPGLLRNAVALFPCFQLRFLDSVPLEQPPKFCGIAPSALVVVELDRPLGGALQCNSLLQEKHLPRKETTPSAINHPIHLFL
jgi:hypothetical protein